MAWLVHDDDAYIKIFHRVHYDWNHKFSSKNHFFALKDKGLICYINIDYCHVRNDKHLLLLLICNEAKYCRANGRNDVKTKRS